MFKKSSACQPFGTCVEVDKDFKRSSSCALGACIEVDTSHRHETDECFVAVRDSKNPEVIVIVSHEDWRVFIAGVKNGEFDV